MGREERQKHVRTVKKPHLTLTTVDRVSYERAGAAANRSCCAGGADGDTWLVT